MRTLTPQLKLPTGCPSSDDLENTSPGLPKKDGANKKSSRTNSTAIPSKSAPGDRAASCSIAPEKVSRNCYRGSTTAVPRAKNIPAESKPGGKQKNHNPAPRTFAI